MTIAITNHATEAFGWQLWQIRRPERLNAIGTSLADELCETLEFFRQNPTPGIRAIVISAEPVVRGDKAIWIAGGDLRELAELKDGSQGRAYAKAMRHFCEGLEYLPLPVVTIVDGAAIGGGAELAISGDIRFATARSFLEFKQLKLALSTGYGAASRLIELVGKSRAQSLLYFCESIDAEEAHRLGLIHRLITIQDSASIGTAILPILQIEPRAIAAQKKMLRLASAGASGDHTWADEIFESIWMNETHAKNLADFTRK